MLACGIGIIVHKPLFWHSLSAQRIPPLVNFLHFVTSHEPYTDMPFTSLQLSHNPLSPQTCFFPRNRASRQHAVTTIGPSRYRAQHFLGDCGGKKRRKAPVCGDLGVAREHARFDGPPQEEDQQGQKAARSWPRKSSRRAYIPPCGRRGSTAGDRGILLRPFPFLCSALRPPPGSHGHLRRQQPRHGQQG